MSRKSIKKYLEDVKRDIETLKILVVRLSAKTQKNDYYDAQKDLLDEYLNGAKNND